MTYHPSPITHHPDVDLPEDVVLSVRNVSKKFCRNLRRSMAYGIKDLTLNLAGVSQNTDCIRRDEFWALDDVSFDLKRGEILGIIGRNGSGKTTLLRILTGIFPPDKGEIALRGRVTSLIALGAGFHPHMTGRENVYLNGTILGMTSREITAKLQQIIDFSEIEDFIDAPVASYSSGMRVRLGFSIAVHLDPDLLFIDEVLAVGDVGFKRKAEHRIRAIVKSGVSAIVVSHNMTQIARLSDEVLHLRNGKMIEIGEPAATISSYVLGCGEMVEKNEIREEEISSRCELIAGSVLCITRIAVESAEHEGVSPHTLGGMSVVIEGCLARSVRKFAARVEVLSAEGLVLSLTSNTLQGAVDLESGTFSAKCEYQKIPLVHGVYYLSLRLAEEEGLLADAPYVMAFSIGLPDKFAGNPHKLVRQDSLELEPVWQMCSKGRSLMG